MAGDESLRAADTATREQALDVSRSFIVQAPAGSGKTGLLIQRYLRLLTIVDEPEEVLAITFTRKAAAEMLLRVVTALRDARAGVVAEQAHQRNTLAFAADVLRRDAELGWGLIQSPRRMRIQTLDAFSTGIARTLPVSSGLGGIASIRADAEMKALYRSAAHASLEWIVGDDERGAAVTRVLSHLDNSTTVYIRRVAQMLRKRDQWLEFVGSGVATPEAAAAARRELEDNIAVLVRAHLRKVRDSLPADVVSQLPRLAEYATGNVIDAGNPDHPIAALSGLSGLPQPDPDDLAAWRGIAEMLLTRDGGWRKRIDRNSGFPPDGKEEKQTLMTLLASLDGKDALRIALHRIRMLPQPAYGDGQWDVLLSLLSLLPLAVAELRRLFADLGMADHIEVALAARAALGDADEPGDIALALDYSIRHLLIDEMQDTSIGQYRLIENLTAGWEPGDGRTLFCVGDPMQSIYRFRDAEVGQFLLARRAGIAGMKLHPLLLRQNFRSGEHLVHWFNTIFSQVMPLEDDVAAGAIAYAESVPVEAHGGLGEYQIHALFDVGADEEARYALDVIRGCLEEHPRDQVALLVRTRLQLRSLLVQLRDAEVEYQAVELDRLTDLPEIIDLLALTRALSHSADRLAWLGMLRGPWVGLTWDDLHRLVMNDGTSTVPELMADSARTARLSDDGKERLRRFRSAIAPFLEGHATRTLRDRVELAWFALGGPALLGGDEELDNVYRFFDVLARIETTGSLRDVRELEVRMDDERTSSKGGPDCRLQIMTMHRAKGLEFDHVVLYGLGRRAGRSRSSVLSWLSFPGESGASDIIVSPIGPQSELDRDPLHRFIEMTSREKEQLELDRLMYVACTRAKRSLHLIGHVGVSADGTRCRPPDAGSLLARVWTGVRGVYESDFAARDGGTGHAADAGSVLATPPLYRLDSAFLPGPPPALPADPGKEPDRDPRGTGQVEYHWVGSAARHAGTIVHRWLQRIADGVRTLEIADVAAVREENLGLARRLGVRATDLDAVCDRVESALRTMLNDERGRWLLDGEGRAELPVTGLWQGRPESIIIDRVRIDDDGVHWIVDYKTSSHEGGGLETFLQQEADRYRPQLEKYATLYRNLVDAPVRTALYFPLLQIFREVD